MTVSMAVGTVGRVIRTPVSVEVTFTGVESAKIVALRTLQSSGKKISRES